LAAALSIIGPFVDADKILRELKSKSAKCGESAVPNQM